MKKETEEYKYRPVLFFILAYFFTWIFWIPAIFLPESISPLLMLIGLFAPTVVSTVFVVTSGSDALKRDLKNKLIGFYKISCRRKSRLRRRQSVWKPLSLLWSP